jgi:hypothetical protein
MGHRDSWGLVLFSLCRVVFLSWRRALHPSGGRAAYARRETSRPGGGIQSFFLNRAALRVEREPSLTPFTLQARRSSAADRELQARIRDAALQLSASLRDSSSGSFPAPCHGIFRELLLRAHTHCDLPLLSSWHACPCLVCHILSAVVLCSSLLCCALCR